MFFTKAYLRRVFANVMGSTVSVEAKVDILDTVQDANVTKINTIDGLLDSLTIAVGTLGTKIDTIDGIVDAIKLKTDTIT